jgi:hypothetical protein
MRLMTPRATRLIASILFLAVPGMTRAQDLSVNSLVDLGLSIPSQTTSWLKGGFGTLDNGGGGGKSLAPVGQALTDLRLELDPSFDLLTTARFAPDQHVPFDILEGYARYRTNLASDWVGSLKLGAFFPPISLENESVGWTSPWTLTPSAINSWVGDELRTIGTESNLEWRYATGRVGVIGAVYWANDPVGTLLADRGWVFDSRPTGLFGEPRVPDAFASQPPLREQPFKEIDHRAGWYAGASVRQDGLGRLTGLYYDNRANPNAFAGNDFAWRTKFGSLGLETDIGDVVLLAQVMSGDTTIEPVQNLFFTTDFKAAYLLAGYYFGDFRVAGRVDFFTTVNHSPVGNGSGEHGRALTLAGSWNPVPWLRLSTELIHVDSSNSDRLAAGLNPRASEFQAQFLTRIAF